MSMQFKRMSCFVEITSELEEDLQKILQKEYTALISTSQTKHKEYLTEHFQTPRLKGDIFLISNKAIFYYYLKPEQGSLEAGGVFSKEKGEIGFKKYLEKLEEIIANRLHQKVSFKEIIQTHSFLEYVQAESSTLEYSEEDLSVAEILKNENLRLILKKAREGIRINLSDTDDLEIKNFKEQEIFYQKLEELNLIKREYVVFCRNTNNQISSVDSLEIIKEAKTRGFKCFSCGRSLNEEIIEQFIELTPEGARFAKPNYWLFLNLIKECRQIGLNVSELFIKEERQSLDWFVYFYPYCLMFEIKEEPLRLGDLLGFLLRAQYYHADYAFIFSLGDLPSEVEYFLKQPQKVSFTVFNSFYDIPHKLPKILEKLQADYIRSNLERLSDLTQLRLDENLNDFFKLLSEKKAKPEEIHLELQPEISETEPPPPSEPEVLPEAPLEIVHISPKIVSEEEILIDFYNKQKQLEEKILTIIKDFKKDDILTKNYQQFEELLNKISNIDDISCAILDLNSGLYIVNMLKEPPGYDLAGTVLSGTAFNTRRIFDDLNLSAPESIILKTEDSYIQLYYISEDILLLTLKKYESEFAGLVKEVAKSKDIIVKNLFKLNQNQGALIIDSDKKITKKEVAESKDEKILSALAKNIIIEAESLFLRLKLSIMCEILINCSELGYYFLYTEDKSILITEKKASLLEEIWFGNLPRTTEN